MSENEQLQTKEDAQREYVGRIETGGGAMSRFEPTNLPSLMDLANMVARSGLCPKALQGKPQDVALVVMSGTERGLSTMQSLQNLHVIYGRVAMSADMIRAQCQRHPDCEHFEIVSATAEKAALMVKKRGWKEPARVEFSIEDAKRAGLIREGSSWKTWPEDMCVARVTSRAARRYFPDVMAGIVEAEEARDIGPEEPKVKSEISRKAQAVAEKVVAATQESQDATKPAGKDEDIVDAEFVEEAPPSVADGAKVRPDQAAEEDAQAEVTEGTDDAEPTKEFRKQLLAVPALGETGVNELLKAGYINWSIIHETPKETLTQVPRIGAMSAANLKKAAAKHAELDKPEAEAPPEGQGEAADDGPEGQPWQPQPLPPGIQKAVFRGADWMAGLRELCEKHGVTWPQALGYARKISGGFDPARLPDKEWKQLIEWVKSATQEGLFTATREGSAGPKYQLNPEHPRYSAEIISDAEVGQLVRFAKSGKGEEALRELARTEWGFELEALPSGLRILMLEAASGDEYQAVLEEMITAQMVTPVE